MRNDFVTNDKSLPLFYTPDSVQVDMPDDARALCADSYRLPPNLLNDKRVRAMAQSLNNGVLGRKLEQKQSQAVTSGFPKESVYLRIALLFTEFKDITAVLELWPAGSESPKHQHGGCAGSVRILHGCLEMDLYDNIADSEPIHGMSKLQLVKFITVWLNRTNWFCHVVRCPKNHPDNQDGFAASVHVYKNCTDEFAFEDPSSNKIIKRNPKNDFTWNVDVPGTDPRNDADDFKAMVLREGPTKPIEWTADPHATTEDFAESRGVVKGPSAQFNGKTVFQLDPGAHVVTKPVAVTPEETLVVRSCMLQRENSFSVTVHFFDNFNTATGRTKALTPSGVQLTDGVCEWSATFQVEEGSHFLSLNVSAVQGAVSMENLRLADARKRSFLGFL
jgi:hypothetical protein